MHGQYPYSQNWVKIDGIVYHLTHTWYQTYQNTFTNLIFPKIPKYPYPHSLRSEPISWFTRWREDNDVVSINTGDKLALHLILTPPWAATLASLPQVDSLALWNPDPERSPQTTRRLVAVKGKVRSRGKSAMWLKDFLKMKSVSRVFLVAAMFSLLFLVSLFSSLSFPWFCGVPVSLWSLRSPSRYLKITFFCFLQANCEMGFD